MINIAHDRNLHQVVSNPTREDNILDLFFTNVPTLVQNVNILPGISDHNIVFVKVLTSSQRINQPRRKIYLYKKGNFEQIYKDLTNYAKSATDNVYDISTVNDLWLGFKQALTFAMDRHIPSKMFRPSNSLPWFKPFHRKLLRRKRRAYNKACRTGLHFD